MRSTAAAVCVCLVASAGVDMAQQNKRHPTAGTEQTKTEREVETVPNNPTRQYLLTVFRDRTSGTSTRCTTKAMTR